MTRAAARIAAAVLLLAAVLAAPASAAAPTFPAPASSPVAPAGSIPAPPLSPSANPTFTGATTAADPNALSTPPSPSIPPPGHRLTSKRAIAIAELIPKIRRVRREHPGAYATAYTKGATQWQVSIFSRDRAEIGQVAIDDLTGGVLESWTGYQVAWTMARGYDGAFGRRVNAWYVWVPMCVLFVAPFLAGRAGRRRWRPSWLHLDLLALLAFSVPLAFFNEARIGLSTPLIYPPLAYLLVRMLLVARRGQRAEPLRLLVPVSWLAVMLVFLIGFRVGLNVANSNVIDVGYSGVIGADRLMDGTPLYGRWPADNGSGDTYGPVNYYAYVPFEQLLPWSGRWDDLPAAHAAAVVFDLLTIVGLFLLGRRIRGPSLGIVLAYAWAAYPFTLYASSTNSNDALVALLLVVALLVAGRPAARGVTIALAGLTKLAPLALAPLFARTPRDAPPTRVRPGATSFVLYALAFGLTATLAMLPVILDGDLRTFWDHTIAFQRERESPFSIWGLWSGLDTLQTAVQLAAVLLALVVAVWPRRPTLVQMAACGAAVLIALQLGVTYWFFLYVVWFFPLVIVALLGRYGDPQARVAEPASGSAEAGRGGHEQLLDPVGAQR
jgi:hypothetical protein